jgi:hypothetical protein
MPAMDEDKVFDALAIRDTASKDSSVSVSGEFMAKTIFIENSLNQEVTLQLQGKRNGTKVNIGAPFVVAASTNSYQTVSAYFPKYCMTAQCSVAPASGSLSVYIIKAAG